MYMFLAIFSTKNSLLSFKYVFFHRFPHHINLFIILFKFTMKDGVYCDL